MPWTPFPTPRCPGLPQEGAHWTERAGGTTTRSQGRDSLTADTMETKSVYHTRWHRWGIINLLLIRWLGDIIYFVALLPAPASMDAGTGHRQPVTGLG
jgi:hypothetical protein